MLHKGLVGAVILAGIAFIVVGISMTFGDTLIGGFDKVRGHGNVAEYTALSDVVEAGPTLIILGFIVMVAIVGFLGIKLAHRS